MSIATAPYPWQQAAWDRLATCVNTGNLPTALLVHGPAGMGQEDFAKAVVRVLLCESNNFTACGLCGPCQCQGHPDAWIIAPNAQGTIAIEVIRDLNAALSNTAAMGGRKVVLILQPEAMSIAAANAFLKMLEEPPGDTCIQLCTHQPQQLLATIRSRCIALPLGEPPQSMALDWLIQQGVSDAAFWLSWTYGSPCLAKKWASETKKEKIDEIAESFEAFTQRQITPSQFLERCSGPLLYPTMTHLLQKQLRDVTAVKRSLWVSMDAWLALDKDLPKLSTEAWLAAWQLATVP